MFYPIKWPGLRYHIRNAHSPDINEFKPNITGAAGINIEMCGNCRPCHTAECGECNFCLDKEWGGEKISTKKGCRRQIGIKNGKKKTQVW